MTHFRNEIDYVCPPANENKIIHPSIIRFRVRLITEKNFKTKTRINITKSKARRRRSNLQQFGDLKVKL